MILEITFMVVTAMLTLNSCALLIWYPFLLEKVKMYGEDDDRVGMEGFYYDCAAGGHIVLFAIFAVLYVAMSVYRLHNPL